MYARLSEPYRTDWLSARVAVKEAYRRVQGLKPTHREIQVRHRATGEPVLTGRSGWRCSLSHARGFGVAVVSRHRIGIDIEAVSGHPPAVLRYVASPREVRAARALADGPDELLTLLWAAKEAVLKAMARGLALPLRGLRISRRPHSALRVDVLSGAHRDTTRWIVTIERLDGFIVGLAFKEGTGGRASISWYRPAGL